MANAKALAEKEKGNTAFKAADYPTAIGHYSAAIIADKTDHTFPLNRAAAYLKLGKYEDAERDCTTVLSLSALNAKALFRRGQARVELGKLDEASADLKQASKREPTNTAITEELKKVESLIAKRKEKTPVKPISVTSPSSSTPKRRRVPIDIVESTSASTPQPSTKRAEPSPKPSSQTSSSVTQKQPSSEDTLKPVSTRILNKSSTTTSQPPPPATASAKKETSTAPPPKPTPIYSSKSTPPAEPVSTVPASPQPDQPRTFKDAKAARETGRPSRVGGGIFRASGQNTIFPTREMTPPGSTPPPQKEAKAKSSNTDGTAEGSNPTAFPISPPGLGRPLTLFDFARSWESKPALEDRWTLITAIPPSKFPSLFQTSLETSLLVSILALFKEVLSATGTSGAQGKYIRECMKSFGEVKRFETVVMFMSKSEKQLAAEIWEQLGVDKADAGNAWGKIWS